MPPPEDDFDLGLPPERPQVYEHMMTVRVTDKERAILEAAAELSERSISSIFRHCINGVILGYVERTAPEIHKLIIDETYDND